MLNTNKITLLFQTAREAQQAGAIEKARKLYYQILDIQPDHIVSLENLGVIATSLGAYDLSIKIFSLAISIAPERHESYYNRGISHYRMAHLKEATEDYKKCLQKAPKHINSFENLAISLLEAGDYSSVIFLRSNHPSMYIHSWKTQLCVAEAQIFKGNIHEARKIFRFLLRNHPVQPEILFKYSLLKLREGQWDEGWNYYRYRMHDSKFLQDGFTIRVVPIPAWNTKSNSKPTLYLRAEQGIGDEVMFASFLPFIIPKVTRIVLECNERLLPLYQRSFGGIDFVPIDNQLALKNKSLAAELATHQLPLGDLPFAANLVGKDTIFKKSLPYLIADHQRVQFWRKKTASSGRINIGLAWKGGNSLNKKLRRTINLHQLLDIFSEDSYHLINIQHGNCHEELSDARVKSRLTTYTEIDATKNIDEFAALLSSLDAIVSIDNSTVHLAGALGTPTYLLLQADCEWRWGSQEKPNNIYQSVTILREPVYSSERNWDNALCQLRQHLQSEGVRRRLTPRQLNKKTTTPASLQVVDLKKPIALILNDTCNWYHWGCSCTSQAIYRALEARDHQVDSVSIQSLQSINNVPTSASEFNSKEQLNYFLAEAPGIAKQIQEAQLVIINGEGTLHNTSKQALRLLYLIVVSKLVFGKSIHLINHSVYPDDLITVENNIKANIYSKIYQLVDYIAVRDRHSQSILQKLNIESTLSFDCLPLTAAKLGFKAKRYNGKPRIIISGSAKITTSEIDALRRCIKRWINKADIIYLTGAIRQSATEDPVIANKLVDLLPTNAFKFAHSEDQWLKQINNASLLISGRYHYSIAAAHLKTPFLLFPSNTPKNEELCSRLQLNNSYLSEEQLPSINFLVEAALENPEYFCINDTLQNELITSAKLNFLHF